MVLVTGDTHGKYDLSRFLSFNDVGGYKLGKKDSVIIAGDFGGVWYGDERDDEVLDIYAEKPYITYFVDGNHENFDLLNKYKVTEVNGAKCHAIRKNLFHVCRGEILKLDGLDIFCFGGATSTDKMYREEGKSWWPQEMPSEAEYENATKNLAKVYNEVDYVITHSAPTPTLKYMADWYETDKLTNWLGRLENKIHYEKWYFGHYHVNRKIDDRHVCLYDMVMRLW